MVSLGLVILTTEGHQDPIFIITPCYNLYEAYQRQFTIASIAIVGILLVGGLYIISYVKDIEEEMYNRSIETEAKQSTVESHDHQEDEQRRE